MSDSSQTGNEFNWVDPDIIAYFEKSGGLPSFDQELETSFKRFFEKEFEDTAYDDLREKWDPLIYNKDAKIRVLGKTGLWSVVQLRKGRNQGINVPIIKVP
jgi:hypothetical protein